MLSWGADALDEGALDFGAGASPWAWMMLELAMGGLGPQQRAARRHGRTAPRRQ